MKKKYIEVTFVTIFIAFSAPSFANTNSISIIASCGASEGQAYFHSNTIVPENESGWSDDRLSEGSLIVELRDDAFDLIYRDQIGLTSAKDSGAEIFPSYIGDKALQLIVIYPANGVAETYNFQHLGTEKSEVSWTSSKAGTLINKSGVYRAKCEP